jgi:hypothetical protein
VSVEIEFSSAKACKSIVNALIPDNVKIPNGLLLQVSATRNTAVISIKSSGPDYLSASLANTLDEVLEHISVASKVVED